MASASAPAGAPHFFSQQPTQQQLQSYYAASQQYQQQQQQQQYGAPAIGGPQAPQPGTQPHEPFPGYTAYPAEGEQPR